MLMEFDRIYVFGQAKSHCVLSTPDGHARSHPIGWIEPDGQVWILEDAMSPVPAPPLESGSPALDFPKIATGDRRLRRAGMHVVKTSDPIVF